MSIFNGESTDLTSVQAAIQELATMSGGAVEGIYRMKEVTLSSSKTGASGSHSETLTLPAPGLLVFDEMALGGTYTQKAFQTGYTSTLKFFIVNGLYFYMPSFIQLPE